MALPATASENRPALAGRDILFILAVFLLFNLGAAVAIGRLYLTRPQKLLIIETVIPVAVLAITSFWLRKKKINPKDLGLRLPAGGIVVPTLVALLWGVLLKLIDYTVFFGPLGRLNWQKYSILTAAFLPITYGIGRVVITPLTEELVFRGIVYDYLRARLGRPAGLLLQALIFTAVHPQVYQGGLATAVPFFFFGLAFGLLAQCYGSLYPAYLCHCTLNYTGTFLYIVSMR